MGKVILFPMSKRMAQIHEEAKAKRAAKAAQKPAKK